MNKKKGLYIKSREKVDDIIHYVSLCTRICL